MTEHDAAQPGPAQPGPAQQRPAPEQWRPSEPDRQAAAERLRVAVDEGRLDLMEYDQRLRQVETAGTLALLHQVLDDLPVTPESVLVQIGEIAVTASTVHTPTGPIPLWGSQWTLQDRWFNDQKIPSWAIVLAILLFFCIGPFSLLFLLAKEHRFTGTVEVGVSHGGQHYQARIPVYSQQQVHHVYQQVNYVRSLASR